MAATLRFATTRLMRVALQACLAAIMVIGLMVLWPLAGRVHGMMLPQAVDFTITSEQVTPTGKMTISGTMRKPWWAVCEFSRVDWYVGVRNGWNRPRGVVFLEDRLKGKTTRAPGISDFGPWLVMLRQHEACLPMFADAIHDCGMYSAITPLLDRAAC